MCRQDLFQDHDVTTILFVDALSGALSQPHTQLSLSSSSSKGVLAVILSGGIGFTPPPLLNVDVAAVDDEFEGERRCYSTNMSYETS